MNRDINLTLSALVPLLRMNGEKVVSVEAVEDWYEIDGREYMKEVAEITYENGYRQYADIGCDANLTAVYDVIRVIQQVKPKSEKIERIVRDVYQKPVVPDTNVGNKAQLSDKGTTFENGGEIKRWSEDIISRSAIVGVLRERAETLRGVYGDLGGACSGAAKLAESISPTKRETATVRVGRTRNSVTMWYECDACGEPVDIEDAFCRRCGRGLIHE